MSPKKNVKYLAEPEFGRTIKIYVWEHGDIFGKCHEIFLNPNQLRTWNSILIYLTNIINPIFGAIRNLVSIKTKKCINCFKDLETHGRYVVLGAVKNIKFTENNYKTESEMEMEIVTKKPVKRFYSGDIAESEFKFLCATRKRKLTIIYVLVNALTCQTPSKVVLTENDLLVWDITLAYLAKILDVPSGIQHLCTIYGDFILDPHELQHGYIYVALPYNEKFLSMDYLALFIKLKDSYNKKGLLLNIRPARTKYGKKIPKLKTVKKRSQLQLQEKQSYILPDAGDGVRAQFESQDGYEINNNGQTDRQVIQPSTKMIDNLDPTKTDLNSAQTQTLLKFQDDAIVVDAQLYTLYNIEKYNNQKQVYSNGSRTEDIVETVRKSVEIQEKMTQTTVLKSEETDKTNRSSGEIKNTEYKPETITQTDIVLKNTTNTDKSTSLAKADISDPVENNIEYFSISVIISKTSKIVSSANPEQTISNLDMSKSCQAQTYCSNIAVSGTCLDKLEVITKIVNDVVIETYKRLIQTNDLKKYDNVAPIDTLRRRSIAISSDNITNTKEETINIGSANGAADTVKRNSITVSSITEEINMLEKNKTAIIGSIKDETISENLSAPQDVKDVMQFTKPNPSKLNGNKHYKVNESNYVYSGCGHVPSLHIQNKTYFNFCDLKSCTKDSCKDIKIRYCKKSSSALDDSCYFYEMTPRIKEYKCSYCSTFPVDEIEATDNSKSSKVEKQYISKTEKETVLNKSVSKKMQSGSITSESQTQSKISNSVYSKATVEKPVKDTMSLDSISGDISDAEINEFNEIETAHRTGLDKQDESEQLKNKDEVSISVNIKKINGSSSPIEEKSLPEQNLETERTVNAVKRNEVSLSEVKLNGTFLQKLAYVKDIINDILKETFNMPKNEDFKTNGTEPIVNISNKKNINKNTTGISNNTKDSFSNKDSRNSTMTFNKINKNQNNKEKSVIPLKKFQKSKSSKSKPIQICQSAKTGKEIFSEECLCGPTKRQVSECCICPKHPPTSGKKNKVSNDNATTNRNRAIENVEELVKNKAVSVSATSRRSNEIEGIDEKFTENSIMERKAEIAERRGSKGSDVNNQSFTRRNSKGEDIVNKSVKMERVFYSKSREREKNENIESEVCSSESEISVDSIEDSACCICVCPVKYKLNISGIK